MCGCGVGITQVVDPEERQRQIDLQNKKIAEYRKNNPGIANNPAVKANIAASKVIAGLRLSANTYCGSDMHCPEGEKCFHGTCVPLHKDAIGV